jgi:hypothetical protein
MHNYYSNYKGKKGRQSQCQRLEWGLGKQSLTPAEILQRDGFEPRTWLLGEVALTNCNKPALLITKERKVENIDFFLRSTQNETRNCCII